MNDPLYITLDNGRVLMRGAGQELDLPYATVRNGMSRERWLCLWLCLWLRMIADRQGLKRSVHINSPLSHRTVNALLYGPSIMRKKVRRYLEAI